MDCAFFMWSTVAIALLGNVLVIRKNVMGFYCWAIANVVLIIHNAGAGDWPQMSLFIVYLGLAIWGIIRWRKGKA